MIQPLHRTLSPRDLATAIGVSESSLKRWADDGRIRVKRTTGGHRRISVSDAIGFIRSSEQRLVQPEVLGLPQLTFITKDAPSPGEESRRLLSYLEDGRATEASGLVLWMYLHGEKTADICDGPIKQSLRELGELWKDRPDGIFLEHRATDLCIAALNQLRATRNIDADAPRALGASPAGDPYLIPSLMAATTLIAEGFDATNLGPDTPLNSLVEAAEELNPAFVWLSVAGEQPRGRARDYVLGLAERLSSHNLSVIVGGRESKSLRNLNAPNVFMGASMQELVAFARGVASRRVS